MSELKPCPFCGGKAECVPFLEQRSIGCSNPDCNMRPYTGWKTKEEAIEAWNKRAGEQKAYEQGYEDGISNFMPIR